MYIILLISLSAFQMDFFIHPLFVDSSQFTSHQSHFDCNQWFSSMLVTHKPGMCVRFNARAMKFNNFGRN